jgi:hypothetical protein
MDEVDSERKVQTLLGSLNLYEGHSHSRFSLAGNSGAGSLVSSYAPSQEMGAYY